MSDTTIEVTDDGGTDVAETTTVEAVAETAKSEGIAQNASAEAQTAAMDADMNARQATDAAQASMTAAAESTIAAAQTQAAAEQTRYTVESLGNEVAELRTVINTLADRLAPQDTPPVDANPSTIEVDAEPQSKGHFLTRKWGKK